VNFNSIDEIYNFLESEALNLNEPRELTGDFKRLMDTISDERIKEKIHWEVLVFTFELISGQVKPIYSATKQDGTLWTHPSFDEISENGFAYLKERAKTVKSDFLIVRYNQILWNSPGKQKHQQYAKAAVDAYLKILSRIDCIQEEKGQRRDCLELLKNGFTISLQIKYKVEEFKSLIKILLFRRNKFHPDLKIFLLKFMLELPSLKKSDFDGCLNLVSRIGASRKAKKPEYFFTKTIFETGLTIAQRLETDTKIWNKRIGDAIVRMAEHRMDDESRIVPLRLFKEAIPYFKAAGLENRVRQIEQKYFELKKELKLSEFWVPIPEENAQMLFDYFKAKVESLLIQSPEEIFHYLRSGKDFLPSKNALSDMAGNQEYSFIDFGVTLKFDINKNISKEKTSIEEKERVKIYESYHRYVNLLVHPFLHRVFVEGIKSNKITYKTLTKFLFDRTWLGQELTDYDSTKDRIKYNWISLIAPSIHEYFLQTESAIKSNNPFTNYVMPIDSMTLKFEGVLRDFAKTINVSTTMTGKGNVLREKYIEELLLEKEIQKYFDENDLLFFNYLFVSKDGMNLRNNIAHSFFKFNNYSFQIMHLLICAFLRIGKYKMKVKGNSI
jgi:hypothetical protein